MSLRSVVALIDAGDGHRDHLPLRPAERASGREHQLLVELDADLQHLRPQALDGEHAEHLARAGDGFVVKTPEEARGLPRGDGADQAMAERISA